MRKIKKYENNEGDRTWIYECGCVETSVAGAYGSIGSVSVWNYCGAVHCDICGCEPGCNCHCSCNH